MYNKLNDGRYSVALEKGFLVFNQSKGTPFAVSNDLYDRMKFDHLNNNDKNLLADTNYLDLESEFEHYSQRIINYIDNYNGPSVLDLIISETCNLGCHMCIHAFSVDKGQSRISKSTMSFETAKKWIDYYMDDWAPKQKLHYLSFHFGAAEPFLNKKCFLESIDYIKNKKTELEKEILVNSNLTMLDDELLEALVTNCVKVSVGLDGLEHENDLIRVDAEGHGTFQLIVNNVKKLVERGNTPGINLTLTDRNYDLVQPYEFLWFMKSLGITAVLVDIDFVLGINVKSSLIISKLLEYQRVADELNIELRGNWLAPFYNLTSEEEIEPKSFCASIRGKNLVVTPNGNLSFCTYSSVSITNSSYQDIDATMSQFVQDMKKFLKSDYLKDKKSRCAKCPLLGFCGGGCHITSEQNGAEALMCDIYKGATSQLLKYHFDAELNA